MKQSTTRGVTARFLALIASFTMILAGVAGVAFAGSASAVDGELSLNPAHWGSTVAGFQNKDSDCLNYSTEDGWHFIFAGEGSDQPASFDAAAIASAFKPVFSPDTTTWRVTKIQQVGPNKDVRGFYIASSAPGATLVSATIAAPNLNVTNFNLSHTCLPSSTPPPPPVCDADETLVDGVCVPNTPVCDADETLVDGVCVPNTPVCDADETLVDGVCVPNTPVCDADETLVDGVCVPNTPVCDADETLVDGVCVPNTPVCDADETLVDGVCVPNTPVCDADETLVDGVCVPNTPVCDADETLVDGVCVPNTPTDPNPPVTPPSAPKSPVDFCPNLDGVQWENYDCNTGQTPVVEPAVVSEPVVVSAPAAATVAAPATVTVPQAATLPAGVPAGDGSQAPGLPLWAVVLTVVGLAGAAFSAKGLLSNK